MPILSRNAINCEKNAKQNFSLLTAGAPIDNVLLEYRLALELKERGLIEKIYPIDYRGFKHLIHIDAYRIDHSKELLHLGWQKIIGEKENLILIEWPERVADIIPEGVQNIFFKFVDETTREIEYEN